MDYESFKSYIIEHIREYLPEEYQEADISISENIKNNDTVRDGLQIKTADNHIVPILYISHAYEEYQEGKEIDDLLSGMADNYIEVLSAKEFGMEIPLEGLGEYDRIKDNIFCCLVNREGNKKRLMDKPYTPIEDLAVTYHIQIKNEMNRLSSIAVTNKMMDLYGVDADTLHEQAVANMEKILPAIISPLRDLMMDSMMANFMNEYHVSREVAREMAEMAIPEDVLDNSSEMICITNVRGINGAACIVSPTVQQKVAEMVGGDYYVLPSSVHEVLVTPKNGDLSCGELKELVQSVNGSKVAEDEVLSDHVYEYSVKERVLRMAGDAQKMDLSGKTQGTTEPISENAKTEGQDLQRNHTEGSMQKQQENETKKRSVRLR